MVMCIACTQKKKKRAREAENSPDVDNDVGSNVGTPVRGLDFGPSANPAKRPRTPTPKKVAAVRPIMEVDTQAAQLSTPPPTCHEDVSETDSDETVQLETPPVSPVARRPGEPSSSGSVRLSSFSASNQLPGSGAWPSARAALIQPPVQQPTTPGKPFGNMTNGTPSKPKKSF